VVVIFEPKKLADPGIETGVIDVELVLYGWVRGAEAGETVPGEDSLAGDGSGCGGNRLVSWSREVVLVDEGICGG
jgi:hypothetical protein